MQFRQYYIDYDQSFDFTKGDMYDKRAPLTLLLLFSLPSCNNEPRRRDTN